MIFQAHTFAADGSPDEQSLLAMRAALRDLKVIRRKAADYPRRAEVVALLDDARQAIDRINQKVASRS